MKFKKIITISLFLSEFLRLKIRAYLSVKMYIELYIYISKSNSL